MTYVVVWTEGFVEKSINTDLTKCSFELTVQSQSSKFFFFWYLLLFQKKT